MASLILLNIYYFRLNIFKKGTFKGLFEKKSTLSGNFFWGEGRQTLPPLVSPPPPAPEGLLEMIYAIYEGEGYILLYSVKDFKVSS